KAEHWKNPGYYERFGFRSLQDLVIDGVPQEYVLAFPLGESKARGNVMPLQRTPSLAIGYKLYRLRIGRSFTVFYQICEEDKLLKILEITTIDKAHKLYKRFGEGESYGQEQD
ncbi:MAG: hypothetical protein ACE14P_15710, partial [Methanotrichaceae archaeon]